MSNIGIGNIGKLKKQIKSVEGIKKVTKAMGLVSTAKIRAVREVLDINKHYHENYECIMNELVSYLPEDSIYLQDNKANKNLIIVIASDRGMCGGYNHTIIDKLNEMGIKDDKNYSLIVIGSRGLSLCKRHGFNVIDYNLSISDFPTLDEASVISKYCIESFLSGEFSKISIIYTWFKNPLVKEVRQRNILPILSSDEEINKNDEFDIVGNCEEIVEQILQSYCSSMILNACLNSKSSEHSIRMETMTSASKSADDLINDLKQKYNRLRQAAITQEISEIVGGTQR